MPQKRRSAYITVSVEMGHKETLHRKQMTKPGRHALCKLGEMSVQKAKRPPTEAASALSEFDSLQVICAPFMIAGC